jgi:long-subunit acyl-CoA synthetase (AMP-forming)
METALKYRNLIDLFHQSLASVTDLEKTCVEIIRPDRHEVLTYRQLQERAQAFATQLLHGLGLSRGDKVAIVSKNRMDFDVALWGAILAGAIPVLIDPERGPQGVMSHLQATDARCLVMADDYEHEEARVELVQYGAAHGLHVVTLTAEPLGGTGAVDATALADAQVRVHLDDTAAILCTSGTTGDPREVELTHGNLIANLQGSVTKVDIGPNDVLGHILPPHHSFGMTVGKFLPLAAGATSVYTNKYREVSDLIREKRITIFIAIPALYTTLAKKLEDGINKQKKEKRSSRCSTASPRYLGRRSAEARLDAVRFFSSGRPRCRAGCSKSYGGGASGCTKATARRRIRRSTASTTGPTRSARSASRSARSSSRSWMRTTARCRRTSAARSVWAAPASLRATTGTRKRRRPSLTKTPEACAGCTPATSVSRRGGTFTSPAERYLIILPGGKNVNPERVETALSEAHFVKEVLVVPSRHEDANGLMEESVRVLVLPAWETLESHTGRSQRDLLAEPQLVKNLIWERPGLPAAQ